MNSYAAARIGYHMENQLPETLSPGDSWVEPYPLGPREPTATTVDLWDTQTG